MKERRVLKSSDEDPEVVRTAPAGAKCGYILRLSDSRRPILCGEPADVTLVWDEELKMNLCFAHFERSGTVLEDGDAN